MHQKNVEDTEAVFVTKHGLQDQRWFKEMMKGLNRRRICHLPPSANLGNNRFDLMLECISIVC